MSESEGSAFARKLRELAADSRDPAVRAELLKVAEIVEAIEAVVFNAFGSGRSQAGDRSL
jgi:flagellar biosynthesis regulator FlbT